MQQPRNTQSYCLTLLWVSFAPTHAAIVFEMEVLTITESGVAIATANAVIVQGLANFLGFFIARALASIAACWAVWRWSLSDDSISNSLEVEQTEIVVTFNWQLIVGAQSWPTLQLVENVRVFCGRGSSLTWPADSGWLHAQQRYEEHRTEIPVHQSIYLAQEHIQPDWDPQIESRKRDTYIYFQQ